MSEQPQPPPQKPGRGRRKVRMATVRTRSAAQPGVFAGPNRVAQKLKANREQLVRQGANRGR